MVMSSNVGKSTIGFYGDFFPKDDIRTTYCFYALLGDA